MVVFVVVSVLNLIPSDESWRGLTLNQVLEDFGVFIFFMALWCGIYSHFRRTVDLTWHLIIFVVAICQEEFNLWNKLWQQICLLFGHEISSSERQHGEHVSTESINQVLQAVDYATTSLTGWMSVVDRIGVEAFRGVEANQKVLVRLYKNHELYRVVVVVDDEYPTKAHNVISSALLSFATPFALVWLFGGLWVVFMHQARVYRIKYGKQFRAMENHQ